MLHGGPIPVPGHLKLPPGRQRLLGRLRRAWRSRKALKGVTQWILDWGLPLLVCLGALYFFAARAESPSGVYRVFAMIDAPRHVLLWLASLVGWLLVPAIIGGFAGHVIAERISRAKSISTHTLFRRRRLRQRLRPPGLIDNLAAYFHGTVPQQDFVDAWVRVAHRNDWARAQDHWEVFVRDTMSTQQYAHLDRHECLRQVQSAAKMALRVTARSSGLCIVCERRR
ncbi:MULTISPECIES: DUF6313 family protein [unclassified Streptomyces]|uniref:DUF6313 family protein n=1 Tax=unclassified Streptomyces TaxID=2593676 RepID=UPI002966D42C|nr:DUF6313 family protein [Streptomyces sp. SCL15-4]